jgi:hypothetical protein
MNTNLADIAGESATSDHEASLPRAAAQQGPEHESSDGIADADKTAMRRLFQEAFRSRPSGAGL